RLASVFQTMAEQVYAREQKLKRQVAELRIEIDQAKKTRQVAEITETDYFRELRRKAKELRKPKGSA
ncbi:MAG: HAMP domain-containing protein, partial [Cyanobacteria bacterium J06642_9]